MTTATAPSGVGRTALLLVLGICFMTGLGWASVPLYRMFCEATGLNGTTQRGLQAPGAVARAMRVDFDTNTSPKLPWRFVPELESETFQVGARVLEAGRHEITELAGEVVEVLEVDHGVELRWTP